MATLALAPYHDGPRTHFVSNVDGAHLADVLKPLDPKRTLILIASKTFTTQETMANAVSARTWVEAKLGPRQGGLAFRGALHGAREVEAFGIDPARMFGFWDWGRRALFGLVGDRPVARHRRGPGAFRGLPRRRAGDGRAFP